MGYDVLKNLGLTNNEIEIYLAILREGKSTGTQLRKDTGIANSRIYAGLDSLTKKGLITYEKLPNKKLYQALDPTILNEIMEEKKKQVSQYIPLLKNLQDTEGQKTETAVFEGLQGFKTALLNMVNECPKGQTVHIIGFSNQAYKNEKLSNILKQANKISIKKKHKFKMILDNKKNKFFKERKKEDISQIRFMGRGFTSPAAIDIFLDTVYILIWDEMPYAFKIKNRNVAEGFKTYFTFMWDMAKS
ncbi:MAG: TrmB family transcriptional regulator [Candidatus Nanoarchaeia archaeon]